MIHEREPCFLCEKREREVGQILCRVCIAWAEVKPRREPCCLGAVETLASVRDAMDRREDETITDRDALDRIENALVAYRVGEQR